MKAKGTSSSTWEVARLFALIFLAAGCAPSYVSVEIPMPSNRSHGVPTYSGKMTVEQAAALLKLAPPVRVIRVDGFEGWDPSEMVALQDACDEVLVFSYGRRRLDDDYFAMECRRSRSGEVIPAREELPWDDPRLMALRILCLHWVDQQFSPGQQMDLRRGRVRLVDPQHPMAHEKERIASSLLDLFPRPEVVNEKDEAGA